MILIHPSRLLYPMKKQATNGRGRSLIIMSSSRPKARLTAHLHPRYLVSTTIRVSPWTIRYRHPDLLRLLEVFERCVYHKNIRPPSRVENTWLALILNTASQMLIFRKRVTCSCHGECWPSYPRILSNSKPEQNWKKCILVVSNAITRSRTVSPFTTDPNARLRYGIHWWMAFRTYHRS